MGFGQVFTTLAFLLIFAGMVMIIITAQRSFEDAAVEVRTAQLRAEALEGQSINIVSTNYIATDLIPWEITYADEFTEGTFANTTTVGDTIELVGGESAGTYTSPVYNTGFASNYTTIAWNAVLPTGADLQFQVRTANSTVALSSESFTGPDGTTASYYTTTGTSINDTLDDTQYIQYRAYFTLGIGSPQLQDSTINVRRDVGHTKIELENDGSQKISYEDIDLYVDGIRKLRASTDRELQIATLLDTRLWNPGENLNVTLFETRASAFSVTVAASGSQDAAVVIP